MVGVKGKYKGCNTCRARRVKCDNTRPLCKKCTDHGRTCEGYERETVFIVGTSDDKGRVASHPPRNLNPNTNAASASKRAKPSPAASSGGESSRSTASRQTPKPQKLELGTIQPLTPAWTEVVSLASVAGLQRFRFVALHTSLDEVVRRASGADAAWEGESSLELPARRRLEARPTFGADAFWLRADCYLYIPNHGEADDLELGTLSDGFCLFLYEQNSSAASSNKPPWKDHDHADNSPYRLGPTYFQYFPEHHFYARIFRPNVIFASMLNRESCPLSSPEWTTVPYEHHSKTTLDNLLDLASLLPSLVARADRITNLPPTLGRRLKAKDLLTNCINVEKQLGAWYEGVEAAAARNRDNPLLYWVDNSSPYSSQNLASTSDRVPFADTFMFASPVLGMAHIYYWTTLIGLYGCIDGLIICIATATDGRTPSPQQAPAEGLPQHQQHQQPLQYHQRHNLPQTQRSYPLHHPQSHRRHSHHQVQSQDPHHAQKSQQHLPIYYPYSASSLSPSPSPQPPPSQQQRPPPPSRPQPSASSSASSSPASMLLPASVDPARYQTREIRKLAANVCRSLDWALQVPGVGHPDAMAAPLRVVEDFYEGIRGRGDGELECLWCEGFRNRLEYQALAVEACISESSGKRWVRIGQFG